MFKEGGESWTDDKNIVMSAVVKTGNISDFV